MVKGNTIDRDTMRKRGWSIHSEVSEPGNDKEEDLNDDEKKALLESFPTMPDDDATPSPASRKRIKKIDARAITATSTQPAGGNGEKQLQLEAAKSKLSKWAARLFDPNRPRGLVEAPQVIPLNDEFLQAFGKREKEFDAALGRTIAIDTANLDEDHPSDDDDDDDENFEAAPHSPEKQGCKIKITNLPFTTTEDILRQVCSVYGPLADVNLLMDKDSLTTDNPLNVGRAYVTFESPKCADACLRQLTTLQGRPLRLSMAEAFPKKTRKALGNGGARYWDVDISTKCFRCGQVGHLAMQCPNEAKPTPCALCGETDHDVRDCRLGRTCFKCGAPGHINRDCKERYPIKRIVCGTCFESGHHRVQCRRDLNYASSQDAVCMVCHEKGHFMCQEMKWFFGLDGITCFNCGRLGHHGYECDRPRFEELARDDELVRNEIDRAEATSLTDELAKQQSSRGRESQRDRDRDRPRPKSQPPQRNPRGQTGRVGEEPRAGASPPRGGRIYTPSNNKDRSGGQHERGYYNQQQRAGGGGGHQEPRYGYGGNSNDRSQHPYGDPR